MNKIGPSLAGVVGRKSGSEPGYNYSPALKAANITWDEKALDQWLQNQERYCVSRDSEMMSARAD